MRTLLTVGLLVAATLRLAQAPASAQPVQDALRGLLPSTLRIVGGEPAQADAWPWQVMVVIPTVTNGKQNSAICGGSLIGRQWVLTAAHCFPDKLWDRSRYIAVAERLTIAQTKSYADVDLKSLHRVEQPIRHPGYSPNTSENDIALLHLDEAALSPAVPLLLASNGELESPPARVIVTGWGRMREIEKAGDDYIDVATHAWVRPEDVDPNRLMQVELPLVATKQCTVSNGGSGGVIDERTLCAGFPEGGKDSCQGDSGGPMVARTNRGRWLQLGIVSWGVGCARKNHPGVYTRVSAFREWIRSMVGPDLVAADDEQAQPEPPNLPPRPDVQFDNAAGVSIAFDKGYDVHVGDRVSYRVTTSKAGFLAVFDAMPDGKLRQIYPNARSMASPTGAAPEAGRARPERPLLIPDYRNPYSGFAIQIVEPRGKGLMVAVLSDTPITSLTIPAVPKTFASTEDAVAAIGRLRGELSRGLVRADGSDRPKWSVDMHEYTIR